MKISATIFPLICLATTALALSNPFPSRIIDNSKANAPAGQEPEVQRRRFIGTVLASLSTLAVPVVPAHAVTRAIGGAEIECREKGNCLETGEWDGAIGWTWGGKDRCDANDPRCGPDGKLRDEMPSGDPVPQTTNTITHIVEISLTVGRTDGGSLKIGLYGEDAPASVEQFLRFATNGLATTSSLAFENGMGVQATPVSINLGGVLGDIVPGERIDFGVPSQAAAYARSRGLSKAGDNFLAQPRPAPISDDGFPRKHDVAGLISIPGKGIGYGSGGFASDDEAYASSFEITAASCPSMDKEGRRVIGQLMDSRSMEFLERLSSLPTKKGFKGVIPGQNSGPPLLAVRVSDVSASRSSASRSSTETS